MKTAVRLLALAGLMALGYWMWTLAHPNPRKVIWRRLERLAQLASFSTNEGQLAKLADVQRIGGFFSDQVVVNVGAPGAETHSFNDRDDLIQSMQAARMAVTSLQAKFLGPKIEVDPGKTEAIVGVVLTADVGGEKDAWVLDLKIEMKKIDGDWLITRVETVE
jgi:hypothetical protein